MILERNLNRILPRQHLLAKEESSLHYSGGKTELAFALPTPLKPLTLLLIQASSLHMRMMLSLTGYTYLPFRSDSLQSFVSSLIIDQ